DLASDVVEGHGVGGDEPSILRATQLLEDYEPAGNDLSQDGSGELRLITSDLQALALPVSISAAGADEPEGTFIDDNGDIVFVTHSRRVVLGYPVLQNQPGFIHALALLGLQLDYDERTNLIVTPQSPDTQALRDVHLSAFAATV